MDGEKIYKMYNNIIESIVTGFLLVICLIIAVTEVNIYLCLLMYGSCVVCLIFLFIFLIRSGKLSKEV